MRCRRMMFPANTGIKSDEGSAISALPREFFNPAVQESLPKWDSLLLT
jgi:hypothetical protein